MEKDKEKTGQTRMIWKYKFTQEEAIAFLLKVLVPDLSSKLCYITACYYLYPDNFREKIMEAKKAISENSINVRINDLYAKRILVEDKKTKKKIVNPSLASRLFTGDMELQTLINIKHEE